MNQPKLPKKVEEWANKQEDPALAKACWVMSQEWFKKKLSKYAQETKQEKRK